MAEWWEWTGEPGPWESNAAPEIDWGDFTRGGPGSWAGQEMTQFANGQGGGNNWLQQLLSGAGTLASRFGGPAASVIGSLTNAGRGSQAAQTAGEQQSQALNRGIDLQTAQWLQQQQNLAPYLQAGRGGLEQLQQLAGREQPGVAPASTQVQRSWYDAQMPGTTPGWTPQDYTGPQGPNAGDYRWNPQQGPQAANYRYTPGQTPDAAQYASGPPQLYQGAMPGTQVPTLSGQELLAQDPGAAFRQTESRKALEASAFAKGSGLSGGTLQALQSRSQDLASQEYGNAWERMMARNKEQYGRDWGQYQQQWNQGVTGAELGLRTNAQNFAQADAAARLREQVNQVASQQGWTQAQAEAVFREQQGQLASQQGWNQALAGQQNQFTQGLETSRYNQQQQQAWQAEQYKRLLEQNQLMYGRDFAENEANYGRNQTQYRQQLAQFLLPWEQQSTLANIGANAVTQSGTQGQNATNAISNLLARGGEAQAGSTLASALARNQGTTTTANSLASVLSRLNS